jgi:hypothetical protein
MLRSNGDKLNSFGQLVWVDLPVLLNSNLQSDLENLEIMYLVFAFVRKAHYNCTQNTLEFASITPVIEFP